MTITETFTLFGILALLAAMPSTSVAFVVTRSATLGIGNGVAVAAGIVVGDLVFILLAILGLSLAAQTMGALFMVIKYLGAAYLLWFGVSLLIKEAGDHARVNPAKARGGLMASTLAGLAITLGDIKAIFFYMSLFPVFIDLTALNVSGVALIVFVTVASVGGVKLVYVFAARKIASLARGHRFQRAARRTAGSFMIGAGAYMMAKT